METRKINDNGITTGEITSFQLHDHAKKKSCRVTLIKIDGELYARQSDIPYPYRDTTKPKRKNFNWKKAITTIAVAATISLGTISVGTVYSDWRHTQDIKTEASMQANTLLVQNGLNVVPFPDQNGEYNWNNNYSRMEITENDIYGLVCYLGAAEAEKVLPVLGYSNWEEFFIAKESFDKEGKPSSQAWAAAEFERIENQLKAEKGAKK